MFAVVACTDQHLPHPPPLLPRSAADAAPELQQPGLHRTAAHCTGLAAAQVHSEHTTLTPSLTGPAQGWCMFNNTAQHGSKQHGAEMAWYG